MGTERRRAPRYPVIAEAEVTEIESETKLTAKTSDLSLGGCYIESMYPFPAGTCLELKLEAGDTLLIAAKVVTCDPQFGNGIQFLRILPEDREILGKFLDHCADEELARRG